MENSIQTTGSNAALIPVFNGTISGQTVQLCCARLLHGYMNVKRDFSNWIKGRIAKFGFVVGEDFITISRSPELASGNRGAATDYHLTLDMAKELSMVENNVKGREARRYFIACEREALKSATVGTNPLNPAIDYTRISPSQVQDIKELVHQVVDSGVQGFPDTWARLHKKFRVNSYLELPATRYEEVCSYLRVKFPKDYRAPAPQQMALPDESIDVAALLLSGQCDPKPLTAAQHTLIDQTAGRLVGEAYPLIRAHLERRVAWNTNAAQQNSAEATQAILDSATLGNCLAHHLHNEAQSVRLLLQTMRQRLDMVLGGHEPPLGLAH